MTAADRVARPNHGMADERSKRRREWRRRVEALAGERGWTPECLAWFDKAVARGEDPGEAAWQALEAFNCLPGPRDDA
jgi:hypothetical protein